MNATLITMGYESFSTIARGSVRDIKAEAIDRALQACAPVEGTLLGPGYRRRFTVSAEGAFTWKDKGPVADNTVWAGLSDW